MTIAVHQRYEMRRLADLRPDDRNARRHSPEQVEGIAAAIREFGFVKPIIISPDGGILAGHGARLAAKRLRMKDVPCLVLDGLSDAQRRAYVLADNRLAEQSTWDLDALNRELAALADLDLNLVGLTGFDLGDLEAQIGAALGPLAPGLSAGGRANTGGEGEAPPPADPPETGTDEATGSSAPPGPLVYQVIVSMDQPTKRLYLRLKREWPDANAFFRSAIEALGAAHEADETDRAE